ncbi:MAG: PTS sugar transporter subunit IIA [bacterium]
MDVVVLQFGVVILASTICYWLFGRLHLPRALGAVLAGVVLGPSLLGHISLYSFPTGLFPSTPESSAVSPELFAFGAVAAVLFFFVHGLETDVKILRNYCLSGCIPAAAGVIVSFVLGDLAAIELLSRMGSTSASFMTPECLFLGLACTATSAEIAVRIFSRKRKLDSPEAMTYFACAASDGLFSVILFGIVLGSIGSFLPAHGQRQYIAPGPGGSPEVVVIWLVLLLIAILAAGKIANLWRAHTDRTGMALVFLGIALVISGLFDRAGLITVLGAYMVGVALSQSKIILGLREKAVSIYGILVPVLFCTIGMMISIQSLTGGVLVSGLILAALIIIARLGVTCLITMPMGLNLIGAVRIGAGMIPRGDVALLILGIGLIEGIIPAPLVGVTLVMITATALVGSLLANLTIGTKASGTRDAASLAGNRNMEFLFPSTETTEMAIAKLLSVFESEGFSIHLLDMDARIYLVRKDDMTIGIQRAGKRLLLDCSDNEAALANTGLCEAIAELEKVISDLRETVNEKAIVRQLQDSKTIGPWKQTLADYLTVSTIKVNMSARTKQEAIQELLDLLATQSLVSDVGEAKKAIWSREEIMSTGMQHGIAIPHGRTNSTNKLICALGLKREGVDFASLDGELSKIMILVLSPDNVIAPYVQLVATIGHVLDEKLRALLLACRSSAEVMTVLSGGAVTSESGTQPAASIHDSPVQSTATVNGDPALGEFIHPEKVIMEMKATTKEEVIDELLHLLEENGNITNFKDAHRAVLEREGKMTTGTPGGVAIPHAITQAAPSLVCAVGINRGGVDYGSFDKKPSTIFIMSLAPREELPRYIQLLGAIGRTIACDPVRQAILGAKTRQEVCDVFTGKSSST